MIINIFKMVKVLTKTTSYSRIRCEVTLVCNLLKYRSFYSRVLGRLRSLHFTQNICLITIGNVLNIFTTEGGPVESTEDS